MIRLTSRGSFAKTKSWLHNLKLKRVLEKLDDYAQKGVDALSDATPVDTGVTAASWYYEIENNKNTITISWKNSNIVKGVPIAIILQYGHGTGTGGWVQGRDYINPAMKPIFDEIAENVWKEIVAL